ncbi:MAG: efflux RND transporter periplasmic adaptor subunit [Alphaproteobacteria bacterium]|nr:efflux RND transporter periplasmic adaptor subunit [Alphaproteobacteria bacterium]MCW5739762.1 efflux RND transporter periplasmic adaptor subunit [Alphaproteobacteria bacterium]
MKTLRLIAIIAAAVLVAGAGAFMVARPPSASSQAAKPQPTVRPIELAAAEVATLQPQRLRDTLRFTGSTQPIDQTTVKSRISARLADVLVREGDRVQAGQVLARFETVELEARVRERLAALEAAKADAEWAEQDRANKAALAGQRVVSRAALDQANAVADAKKAQIAVAQAQVELARKALADAQVVAPFAGVIGERLANPGESLPIDGRILTLLDTSRMEVAAQVPSADVVRLRADMAARVQIEGFGERDFKARIARISPTTQSGSRSVLVFVEILDRDEALRGGLFTVCRVVVAESAQALAVPPSALRKDEAGDFVLLVRDGVLVRQAVTPGRAWPKADLVEIGGVGAGMQLVVAPLPGLKPGQAVKVQSAP